MPIAIAPGTHGRIRRNADAGIFLQAQGVPESQQEAAKEGLSHAWDVMMAAFDPEYIRDVSPVIPTPDGPVVSIDAPGAPRWVLEGIPEVLARCLRDAGVTEATVVALGGNLFDGTLWKGLREPARAVTLRLYPPPPPFDGRTVSTVPDHWLAMAHDWLRDGSADGARVRASVSGIEFDTTIDAVPALWQTGRGARADTIVASGDLRHRIRGVNTTFMAFEHNLALGEGGPDIGDEGLVDIAEHFAEMARRLASEVAHAFVNIGGHHAFASAYNCGPWGQAMGFELNSDEFLFDGFAWQMLGPGHVQRLGGVPPGARALDGGRVELAIGAWRDWFPEDPDRRTAVQEQARGSLAPLLSKSAMDELWRARRERVRQQRFTNPDDQ